MLIDGAVHLGRRQAQRCHTRRNGNRVTRQCARLIHRALRCEVVHDVAATAERGGGQPTRNDLAEGGDVPGHPINAEPTTVGRAEPRHHLIHDQQRAVLVGNVTKRLIKARQRCDRPHVPSRRLSNDARNAIGIVGKHLAYRLTIVVGNHNRVPGSSARHTWRVWQ